MTLLRVNRESSHGRETDYRAPDELASKAAQIAAHATIEFKAKSIISIICRAWVAIGWQLVGNWLAIERRTNQTPFGAFLD